MLRSARTLAVSSALLLSSLLFGHDAHAIGDPNLKWKTKETPHFRITYYANIEDAAEYIADLAEAIHERMIVSLDWKPSEKVEIALTDFTDSANGSASPIPYNAVRLYLTAPDDLSPLGDVDDWYQELFTHEYTHTLHIDQMRGIPAIMNVLLGRTFVPNQVQPRWILEGLAIFEESARTSGGRLRSSQWQMYMRTDVLEDNLAPLDVFSNTPRRWPQGNIWYLYGSFFLNWIAETFGEEALRVMIREYGSNVIPFGVNRAIRRATNFTFEELYPAWVQSMKRDAANLRRDVEARGLRQGTRITFGGQMAQHPRFIPPAKVAAPNTNGGSAHATSSVDDEWSGFDLAYFREDGHTASGHYALKLDRAADGRVVTASDPKMMVRTNGVSALSFGPDREVLFDSTDFLRHIFAFSDLFKLESGKRATAGFESSIKRLTEGLRAQHPSISPDGKHVVFVTNHNGVSTLQIADYDGVEIFHPRTLVSSGKREQAYAPMWSPDNHHVAYSAWTRGGFRDLRYVDVRDGSYTEVTRDRAIDGGPAFSPDGESLYFHSDRTGISNIYRWKVSTGALEQVTNVLTGAYQPAVSPDGRTLAYVGYTHKGFDLFAMPLQEDRFLPALPYVDNRPPAPPIPSHKSYPSHDYNPLETLRPRAYSLRTAPGNFGQSVSVSMSGSDIVGMHGVGVTVGVEAERPEVQFDLSYSYGRLPFDLGMRAYRTISPRDNFSVGESKALWIQENLGVETSLSFVRPRSLEGQNFSISYGVSRISGESSVQASQFDPYAMPSIPQRGIATTLSLDWGYSNAQRFLWSTGAEKGFSTSVSLAFTHPAIGSEYSGILGAANFTGYLPMPWFKHHTLALHVGAGSSAGSLPGRSTFFIGGFSEFPVIDTVRNLLVQGGIQLRGYPSASQVGRNYALFNAEYRFPIVNIDRGISTLPLFFNRLNGSVFFDYGTAFNFTEEAKLKAGVGGELWLDTTLAYVISLTFRFGFAHGIMSQGLTRGYFVAAVPF
ncbi:MAG: PD40 domain-containing protein [Polyangiaceae bacterium]|nr:PD40 domain-containing protein [Polyangiaceae bacterium]